jgi:Tfp pilus assembly protein PilF
LASAARRINQQVYNRLLASYEADHGQSIDEAVQLTHDELTVRHDVYGYDAYAWALYRTGRYDDAKAASVKALSQGTVDAKLWYHAGLIDKARNDQARARQELGRALAISPKFDPLQSRQAELALSELQNAPAG